MIVFLIGYMASGKSYLGSVAANKMNIIFHDLDFIIEKKYKMSINEIFIKHGEDYFRKIEHEVLIHLDLSKDAIVATGGGTPCYMQNMSYMLSVGKTIHLQVHIDTIYERLKSNKSRPVLNKILNKRHLYRFIEKQLFYREPIYQKSDYILSLNDKSINKLLNLLKKIF